MSYKKAEQVLPIDLLELIQEYIDGECIYIPRKPDNKRAWGENTNTRMELENRDKQIYQEYLKGRQAVELCELYCLSMKSIQRILLKEKRKSIV